MPVSGAFDVADVTAAILAGGAGVRVGGQDKGLLLLAGEPLIARVCRSMRVQSGVLVICANRHRDDYAVYATVLADSPAGFHGPLAGIAAALDACATPWLLTVPVDCPAPPVDLAQRLHDRAIAAGAVAAVAHDGDRAQPLFAIYRRDLAQSARNALHHDAPVWRWQRDCGTATVDFSDQSAQFANLNTIEAFRHWETVHVG